MLSKIDYGLPIYGICCKSHIKIITSTLYTAIRRSLRAHRTTPIKNLLAEGGFTTIEDRITFTRCGLIPKLAVPQSHILFNEIKLLKTRTNTSKLNSGRTHILRLAQDLGLLSDIPSTTKQLSPIWTMNENLFINTMTSYKKETTSTSIYKSLYAEIVESLNNWSFIFTDGSKKNDISSFAVVKEDGTTIRSWILTVICGVYEAEGQAILSACELIKNTKGKYVICTDCRSIFEALKVHTNSEIVSKIQQALISIQNKTKIMWIPGHVGIKGNEFADCAAKAALTLPLH